MSKGKEGDIATLMPRTSIEISEGGTVEEIEEGLVVDIEAKGEDIVVTSSSVSTIDSLATSDSAT